MRSALGFLAGLAAGATLLGNAHATYKPAPERIVRLAMRVAAPQPGTPAKRAWAVCRVWRHADCRAVLNVAWCESGLRPWAVGPDDEHGIPRRGLFQMGSDERATYGDGRDAWAQARAGYAYWLLSHWGPWQCVPLRE